MMEPVSDGVDSAMPADIVIIGTSRMTYGVPDVTNENSSMPRAARPMPERDGAVQADAGGQPGTSRRQRS